MPEKTRLKKDGKKTAVQKDLEKSSEEKLATDEKGNWSEDQREKSYYYDDAHGYEIYNPEDDDE